MFIALFVVLFLPLYTGPIKFRIASFNFEGAAAPIILWVFGFLGCDGVWVLSAVGVIFSLKEFPRASLRGRAKPMRQLMLATLALLLAGQAARRRRSPAPQGRAG
jgi:hypothetical protein